MSKNKIRFHHNKLKDTAFLFESLVRSIAKAKMDKDENKASRLISTLKQHFSPGTELSKELKLYRVLEEKCESRKTASRIISEAVLDYSNLSQEKILSEQQKLICESKELVDFDQIFVPNYKNLATIYQIFHRAGNIKERLILEDIVVSRMTEEKSDGVLKPLNNLVISVFSKKFNEVYKDSLLKEQKETLQKYITSFTPEGNLEFKYFLNEEIGRLKKECKVLLEDEDVKKDSDLTERTNQIALMLEGYSKKRLTTEDIGKILKIQQLIGEK